MCLVFPQKEGTIDFKSTETTDTVYHPAQHLKFTAKKDEILHRAGHVSAVRGCNKSQSVSNSHRHRDTVRV